jgi:hypothetical protein
MYLGSSSQQCGVLYKRLVSLFKLGVVDGIHHATMIGPDLTKVSEVLISI